MADRSPGNNEIGVLQKQLRDKDRRIEALESASKADAARIDALEDRIAALEARKVRA